MKKKSRNYSHYDFYNSIFSLNMFRYEKKKLFDRRVFINEGCIGIVAFCTLKDIEEINQSFAFQHLTIFFCLVFFRNLTNHRLESVTIWNIVLRTTSWSSPSI